MNQIKIIIDDKLRDYNKMQQKTQYQNELFYLGILKDIQSIMVQQNLLTSELPLQNLSKIMQINDQSITHITEQFSQIEQQFQTENSCALNDSLHIQVDQPRNSSSSKLLENPVSNRKTIAQITSNLNKMQNHQIKQNILRKRSFLNANQFSFTLQNQKSPSNSLDVQQYTYPKTPQHIANDDKTQTNLSQFLLQKRQRINQIGESVNIQNICKNKHLINESQIINETEDENSLTQQDFTIGQGELFIANKNQDLDQKDQDDQNEFQVDLLHDDIKSKKQHQNEPKQRSSSEIDIQDLVDAISDEVNTQDLQSIAQQLDNEIQIQNDQVQTPIQISDEDYNLQSQQQEIGQPELQDKIIEQIDIKNQDSFQADEEFDLEVKNDNFSIQNQDIQHNGKFFLKNDIKMQQKSIKNFKQLLILNYKDQEQVLDFKSEQRVRQAYGQLIFDEIKSTFNKKTKKEIFGCPLCDYTFCTKSKVNRHFRKHIKVSDNSIKMTQSDLLTKSSIQKCSSCRKQFKGESALRDYTLHFVKCNPANRLNKRVVTMQHIINYLQLFYPILHCVSNPSNQTDKSKGIQNIEAFMASIPKKQGVSGFEICEIKSDKDIQDFMKNISK